MEFKVLRQQNNSSKCLVCGLNNSFGLHGRFYECIGPIGDSRYECEDDVVVGVYNTRNEHQSYPGVLHGGMTSTILDEAIGRANIVNGEQVWGMTTNLQVRFKKPAPLGQTIYSVAKITARGSRFFSGEATLYNSAGNVLATAVATYLAMPIEKISGGTFLNAENWFAAGEAVPDKIIIG